jgi:hypothetical protein
MVSPSFIIIGAMKCGTSTLHEQLAMQPGVTMSVPKEPCFFSDDEIFQRGSEWYAGCFAHAAADSILGESSTHYTKRTVYPRTVERIRSLCSPTPRFVYVMRHPIDRAQSQFVHEWTMRRINANWHRALEQAPDIVANSLYTFQLRSWLEAFGRDRVLPVFLERLRVAPDEELRRVARFVGVTKPEAWRNDIVDQNISSNRIRRSRVRNWAGSVPLLQFARGFIPESIVKRLKSRWKMSSAPPIPSDLSQRLQDRFDEDLAQLGVWLNRDLSCDNFKDAVVERSLEWDTGSIAGEEVASLRAQDID